MNIWQKKRADVIKRAEDIIFFIANSNCDFESEIFPNNSADSLAGGFSR